MKQNHWGQVHRPWSHRDRYVGSLVYRESVVPVPMILCRHNLCRKRINEGMMVILLNPNSI